MAHMSETERVLVNAVNLLADVVEELAIQQELDDEEAWGKLEGVRHGLLRRNLPAYEDDQPDP